MSLPASSYSSRKRHNYSKPKKKGEIKVLIPSESRKMLRKDSDSLNLLLELLDLPDTWELHPKKLCETLGWAVNGVRWKSSVKTLKQLGFLRFTQTNEGKFGKGSWDWADTPVFFPGAPVVELTPVRENRPKREITLESVRNPSTIKKKEVPKETTPLDLSTVEGWISKLLSTKY